MVIFGILLIILTSALATKAMQTVAYISDTTDALRVKENCFRLGIVAIPELDNSGCLRGLWTISKPIDSSYLPHSVVIMAGGLGKRLRPYTSTCPKPMLTIGDRPILEIILEQLVKYGFRKFYFSVNYLKDIIISHFDDGSFFNADIKYLIEDKPLGTAGPLYFCHLKTSYFSLNGDVLTTFFFEIFSIIISILRLRFYLY